MECLFRIHIVEGQKSMRLNCIKTSCQRTAASIKFFVNEKIFEKIRDLLLCENEVGDNCVNDDEVSMEEESK